MEQFSLSKEQFDVLKEIGTIGGGSAATALSQILKRRVSIEVPQVKLVSADRISASEFLIAPDELAIAVEMSILGALQGGMLVLISQKSGLSLIDLIMKRPSDSSQLLNLLEVNALSESSHILCCAYLNAIGELLNLHQLIGSIPQTKADRMDRLNLLLKKKFTSDEQSYILPIENNLVIEDVQVSLFVIFLLSHDSIRKILNIIGV
ncbi:MAG: chemotaxis protein CheC [Deltaproteobacteria bacterium]